MLDQLVESKSGGQKNKTRDIYLLTTSVLVIGFLFSALTWSLFAKELKMGEGNLDVSTLVAPIAENAPAPVVKQQKPEQTNQAKSPTISRQVNMLRIDENPIVPKDISTTPNMQKARPNSRFDIAPDGLETDGMTSNSGRETIDGDNIDGIKMTQTTPNENTKKLIPPPEFKKPPVEPAPKLKPLIKSLGVVNGNAKFLPKPIYTAAAKAVRATGDVSVQVLIDESGNVVSATASGGHPLLRMEAEKAARNAKFNPTLLSNQPVKVSGIIVYKFSM